MKTNTQKTPTTELDGVIQYAKALNKSSDKHPTREAALAELMGWYSSDKLNVTERLAPIEHMYADLMVFAQAIEIMAELLENINQTN